ncbi:MAG: Crp/Fnr family transcriptional regulator [Sulfitobacter sp.]
MNFPAPFTALPDSARSLRTVDNGMVLFRQGDPTQGIFAVVTGAIHLVRHTRNGHRAIMHRAGSGALFAEASLFSDHYHCEAVASERSVVARLDKSAIFSLMKTDPEFALLLAQRFAQDVQTYRRRLEVLSINGAEDRVFAALLSFGQTGTVITLAAMIGLSHEATYRALSSLVRQDRIMKVRRGRYAVRPA